MHGLLLENGGFGVIPPASELLFEGTGPLFNPWPKRVLESVSVLREASIRRSLADHIRELMLTLPVTEKIEKAYEGGRISTENTKSLFSLLGDFLDEDTANKNAMLYIPFEWLPSFWWKPKDRELFLSVRRFQKTFVKAWRELLEIPDVRSSFTDGDRPEHGKAALVVKAAHLIPMLVSRGLIAFTDVAEIYHNARSELLKQCIEDCFPLLLGSKLIEDADMTRFGFRRVDIPSATSPIAIQPSLDPRRTLFELERNIEHVFLEHGDEGDGRTRARHRWMREDLVEKYIRQAAEELSLGAASSTTEIGGILHDPSVRTGNAACAVIFALENLIRRSAKRGDIQKQITAFLPFFADVLADGDISAKDAVRSALCRLSEGGVVGRRTLEDLGVPKLVIASRSQDRIEAARKDLEDVIAITKKISTTPELCKYIYPLALVFGSRVRGDAKSFADLDIAVLIRPDTPTEERDKVHSLIASAFVHEKIQSPPVEFWIKRSGDRLTLPHPEENTDASYIYVGDIVSAIPLLSVWCGEKESLDEMFGSFLPTYLESGDLTICGENARSVWLKEMEQSVIQFRLMHKTYARFFPRQGGISAPYAASIDHTSMFYDSGFRRLATLLYLERVFLPKLKL